MASSKTIDPQAVIDALLSDPDLAGAPDDAREILASLGALLPDAIGESRFDQPFAMKEYLTAEVDFLNVVAESDLSGGLEVELMKSVYGNLAYGIQSILDDFETFLATSGETEESLLHSPDLNFRSELLDLAKAGKLTFGEVLRRQPYVFIPKPQ